MCDHHFAPLVYHKPVDENVLVAKGFLLLLLYFRPLSVHYHLRFLPGQPRLPLDFSTNRDRLFLKARRHIINYRDQYFLFCS